MIKLLTLTLLLLFCGQSKATDNEKTSSEIISTGSSLSAEKSFQTLNNVKIYPNISVSTIIVDFHNTDFKSVNIVITDLSGTPILTYNLGDIEMDSFAELNLPSQIENTSVIVSITSEGKQLVKRINT